MSTPGENGVKQWLMLIYKIPREPTAGRVYAWRKLKQLGALLLQDSVWVLPATSATQEQLRWLVAEIVELGGEATLWRSELALAAQDQALVSQFESQIEAPYREILKSLKRKKPDLAALSRKYQQVLSRDYFQSDLGKKVRRALLAAQEDGEA
jgi:DNA-binding transcriptional regulator PaaX